VTRRPGNNAQDLAPAELLQWIADAIDVPVAVFFGSDDDPASPVARAAKFLSSFNAIEDPEERERCLIHLRAQGGATQ